MKFFIAGQPRPYIINKPELIPTPRLIVFADRVVHNVKRMSELLSSVNPDLTLSALCPHVKTHKSAWVTRLMLAQGISFFKSSLHEVDMLVDCKVPKILVAYPLLTRDAGTMADKMRRHPDIHFYVQMAQPQHVEILTKVAEERGVTWHYYIDVNVGMHRTGLLAEEAFDYFSTIANRPFFDFTGLHAYDGHIHHRDVDERRRAAAAAMQRLQKSVQQFTAHGVQVRNCIVAGTPSFMVDAEYWQQQDIATEILYSPGTWIYSDTLTNEILPNTFDYAALILAQVIDKPAADTATLNLGHKRWAIDQGPVDTFSVSGLVVHSCSEEHTVVTVPDRSLEIADYVLIAPRHVCSTVNLWEFFTLIDEFGDIVDVASPVTSRNR